jgi:hypothetical protein
LLVFYIYPGVSGAIFVFKNKVSMLSSGKQRPITRGVNREQDPILVSFNPPKTESPAPSTPGEKKDEKKSWWSFGS